VPGIFLFADRLSFITLAAMVGEGTGALSVGLDSMTDGLLVLD